MCLSLQSYYLCGKDSHFWFLLYSLAHNSVVMTAVLWNYQKSSSCCSVAKSCPTLCIPMDCSMLGFPGLLYFPELKSVSIESVVLSNHLILYCPLLLPPSIFPRIFSKSALRIRWPKYWSFSFNISPSNEYSGLISFRIDWLDLLAVQGTLKSLLQHHSAKASMLILDLAQNSDYYNTGCLYFWI